jgi:hypothetical protein
VLCEGSLLLSVAVAGVQWARFIPTILNTGTFVIRSSSLPHRLASWQMPPVAEKFAAPPDAAVKPPPVQVHPRTHTIALRGILAHARASDAVSLAGNVQPRRRQARPKDRRAHAPHPRASPRAQRGGGGGGGAGDRRGARRAHLPAHLRRRRARPRTVSRTRAGWAGWARLRHAHAWRARARSVCGHNAPQCMRAHDGGAAPR